MSDAKGKMIGMGVSHAERDRLAWSRDPGHALWAKGVKGRKRGERAWLSDETLSALIPTRQDLPLIVCLLGSTRFYSVFQEANFQETMAHRIVLTVGFYPHSPEAHGESVGITADQKAGLDRLHKRKIHMADEVLVLNQDHYIGDSTRSEVRYALMLRRPVRFLHRPNAEEIALLGVYGDP